MKKIKFTSKKQEKAYSEFLKVFPGAGDGRGMVVEYAQSYIRTFNGKDSSPREILESFTSDLDYALPDVRDTLRELEAEEQSIEYKE